MLTKSRVDGKDPEPTKQIEKLKSIDLCSTKVLFKEATMICYAHPKVSDEVQKYGPLSLKCIAMWCFMVSLEEKKKMKLN